jgi:hypothetical protein
MKRTSADNVHQLEIRLEILRSSYWEHFKFFNDKSTGGHVKTKVVEGEIQRLVSEIENLKKRIENVKAGKGNKVKGG